MTQSWEDLREEFIRVVFQRGVSNVSHLIPADRATVYRIVTGQTERPSRAVIAGIERVVSSSQVQHPRDTQD